MLNKPVIGLTSTRYFVQTKSLPGIAKIFVNEDYSNAIEKVAGIPMIIPPVCRDELIENFVDLCDGFVITGGRDVHPMTYNALPNQKCDDFDKDVDDAHIKLIKLALKKDKPVLGICRGCQLLNVALGGTLYQDIETEAEFKTHGHVFQHIKTDVVHPINIENDSILYRMFKQEKINVNSIHHQAVKETGEGVEICAKANDGIIECIAVKNKKFALGIQWHPEMLLDKYNSMLCIFEEFINSAKL